MSNDNNNEVPEMILYEFQSSEKEIKEMPDSNNEDTIKIFMRNLGDNKPCFHNFKYLSEKAGLDGLFSFKSKNEAKGTLTFTFYTILDLSKGIKRIRKALFSEDAYITKAIILFNPKNPSKKQTKLFSDGSDLEQRKRLSKKTLKFNWIEAQKKNLNRLNRPNPFCQDVYFRDTNCENCLIPAILCREWGEAGFMGSLKQKYSPAKFLSEIEVDDYLLVRKAFTELAEKGILSPNTKKLIEGFSQKLDSSALAYIHKKSLDLQRALAKLSKRKRDKMGDLVSTLRNQDLNQDVMVAKEKTLQTLLIQAYPKLEDLLNRGVYVHQEALYNTRDPFYSVLKKLSLSSDGRSTRNTGMSPFQLEANNPVLLKSISKKDQKMIGRLVSVLRNKDLSEKERQSKEKALITLLMKNYPDIAELMDRGLYINQEALYNTRDPFYSALSKFI